MTELEIEKELPLNSPSTPTTTTSTREPSADGVAEDRSIPVLRDRALIDADVAKYSRAVIRFDRERWAKHLAGDLPAALARIDELLTKLGHARAEALIEAANEIHVEARWQESLRVRGDSTDTRVTFVERLLMVEQILSSRAMAAGS